MDRIKTRLLEDVKNEQDENIVFPGGAGFPGFDVGEADADVNKT